MRVSATMIVKDEQHNLPRCLASLKGLADEIVIVDTGSTDDTVLLAREMGATVVIGGDRMHKGASRNVALDYASGDWIFVIDADEEVDNPAELRAFLEGTDADAVHVRMTRVDEGGNPTLSQRKMQLWRRGLYRWRYRAHETPFLTNGASPKVARTEHVVWHHHRHADGKLQYALDRLELDVAENPDAARPLFYLARQYYYVKRLREARERFEEYLTRWPGAWDAADAWAHLGLCYKAEGRWRDYVGALYQAVAIRPRRREWWGELAQAYYDERVYDVAAGLLSAALALEQPQDTYRDARWYGPHIYDLAARALYYAGRRDGGRAYAVKAVEMAPDNKRYRDNLAYFGGDE